MGAGRIALVVVGSLALLIGFALLVSGGVLGWAHATQRDGDGYYRSGGHRIESTGHAVTSEHIDLGADVRDGEWFVFDDLGTVRIDATSPGGEPLFVGIGPSADVDRYLAGVAHHEIDELRSRSDIDYRRVDGDVVPGAPSEEGFWAASAVGQPVRWDVDQGEWTVVVMDAAGGEGVVADVEVGIKTDLLAPLAIGLAVAGVLGLGAGAVLLILGLRHTTSPPSPPAPSAAAAPGVEPAAAGEGTADPYPARLDATLDEPLSRWLWLVKFVLVVPHVVVLLFLWLAAFVLTVVAGVAILFTGRYPRSLFDFNVGVMRWTWRVGFYAFAAFGTDRYPPFRLGPDAGYPADFEVDYPERLSRGLVLVKWWLLALPHLVIVSIFSGGWSAGADDGLRVVGGGGLIGVVALIAAAVLLFRGRYPRELFHFVMGLNRWCFRVLAYVALMRDEYPPFRFDGGGTDPGTPRTVPQPPVPPAPAAPDPEPPLVGTGPGAPPAR